MDIILKEDIQNLGHKDDIVSVKDGYARNYLIPKGMAIIATKIARKNHEEILKQRSHKIEKMRENATEIAAKLEKLDTLRVGAKTSSTGKIFGSINTIMLSEALKAEGFDIDRKNITIKEDSVKELGTYNANIKLFKDIKVDISFEVISE
ncbi:MAG: 50S ribosomal protein L9 [Bacteroidales bacterium]|jgi:large subunit ribosomal protein L9|nr:50S ribosomal protein L9 [Bacteroidales bacterium]